MAYTKQTWIDDNAAYPVSAARMGVIEQGVFDAAATADQGHRILTTAQRDALGVVTTGTEIYNTTTAQTEIYTGSAWASTAVPGAWTSYTPTLTNTTAPITFARYCKVGKLVIFSVLLTLTGAQVTGAPGITLPVAARAAYSGNFYGMFDDTGSASWSVIPIMENTTKVDLYAANAAVSYVTPAGVSATVPFTWAATDKIYLSGTYEAA